jgi:Mg-chelatase subunit ChlD
MTTRTRSLIVLLTLVAATAALSQKILGSSLPPNSSPPLVEASVGRSITGSAATSARIEAVFVLDTTGSMSALIQGAKDTIWSIANQLADGEPRPDLRIGLVAYRDRGDVYVTKRTELTDDIDKVYAQLQKLTADGGGDTPESVNEALHEALTAMAWSANINVYRVVFLVGDAPPKAYPQTPTLGQLSVLAKHRGININTIQCGSVAAAREPFERIASLAGGRFAAIAQDGAVVVTTTPVDEALQGLNQQLAATAVPYGDSSEQKLLQKKLHNSLNAPVHRISSRGSYMNKRGGALVTGRSDLVDAVGSGTVDLDSLPAQQLPPTLQSLSTSERKDYVQQRVDERHRINEQIAEISAKRDAYLKKERQRLAQAGKGNSFDQNVLDAIRQQAASKGIVYK